jgi:hypothetical protein
MNNTYAFHAVRADTIRGGDKADIEGTVTYVGDNLANYYVVSKNLSGIPDEVVEAVAEQGLTVIDGVDGGWVSWNGRPEFSDTYVDVSDTSVVVE